MNGYGVMSTRCEHLRSKRLEDLADRGNGELVERSCVDEPMRLKREVL